MTNSTNFIYLVVLGLIFGCQGDKNSLCAEQLQKVDSLQSVIANQQVQIAELEALVNQTRRQAERLSEELYLTKTKSK